MPMSMGSTPCAANGSAERLRSRCSMHLSRPRWTTRLLTCRSAGAVSVSRTARFLPWKRLPRTSKKVALLRPAPQHQVPRVPEGGHATDERHNHAAHVPDHPPLYYVAGGFCFVVRYCMYKTFYCKYVNLSIHHATLWLMGFATWPGSACSRPSTSSTRA